MKPLRFCMITTFYPPYNFGGDGIFVQKLSHELARRGHHVEIIHCIDAYRLRGSAVPERHDDHPNVTVHGLKSSFGFLSPLATQQTGYPLFKARRIKEILKKGFDVIHYHNISLIGGPKVLEYGNAVKLYTMHEYWLVCPTHLLFKFNREICTQPNCLNCEMVYRRPPQWWRQTGLLKRSLKHVDAFIAPSRFVKDIHYKMGLDIPIVHLPHFLSVADDEACGRVKCVAPKPYFLFVGRLEKVKGLQTLIPVFRRYRKARLLVVGSGSDEDYLRTSAKGAANIEFLGYKEDSELKTLYLQATAVIVPSVCYEVFSLVTLEAFGRKVPVIARDTGGLPETVRESGAGFVYSTEEELVTAMDQLLQDTCERNRLGLLGYRAYQDRWTANTHLDRYLALIDEIAVKRGRPLDETAATQG